jgi:CRISPR/Cas system-associated exonuclease Cas4 (RecB family)
VKLLDLIPQADTWKVIDPSKLSTYMHCPRRYFYEYVLHWREDFTNNHLHFGSCWHLAVEHLLNNNYSKESVEEAKFLFFNSYRKEFDSETDALLAPKDPANAMKTLEEYAKRFARDARDYQVLYTEVGGHVLLAPDSPMFFKVDALLHRNSDGKVICLDHKTSQRRMGNWNDQWQLSTQMLTYLHVLYCLFGDEGTVGGIRVRCSFFYKAKPAEFDECNVEKTPAQMQAFIDSTGVWYASLEYDTKYLVEEESTETPTMRSFPQNEKACFSYGKRCSYFDFCNAWSNPLTRCADVPLGFKKEVWDPRVDSGAKVFMDLTKPEQVAE